MLSSTLATTATSADQHAQRLEAIDLARGLAVVIMALFVYPVLTWIGVMRLGFGTAPIFELPPEPRDRAKGRRLRDGRGDRIMPNPGLAPTRPWP